MGTAAGRAAEDAARRSYGRLVAILAARSHDIAAAQDALSEAFAIALAAWPRQGVPDRPDAWLLTVARRELGHAARAGEVRRRHLATLAMVEEDRLAGPAGEGPDRRLELMFACAHPAIEPAARAPLMLQAILGIEAGRVASAFLVSPAAMRQRLVRAKTKIRDAGIRFAIPGPDELPARADAVLDAIYAAFGSGWDDADGADGGGQDLTAEAMFLGRVMATLLPGMAEVRGLLALMLHCEARRAARRSPAGDFVPLSEQDPAAWSRALIDEAERHLAAAASLRSLGRYQLEAAIQSAHNSRCRTVGAAPWPAILQLYEGLLALHPSIGAAVGRAAAAGAAHGAAAGLIALDALPADDVAGYQPYWAARAHVLAGLDRPIEAREAYARAAGLAQSPVIRRFLQERMAAL